MDIVLASHNKKKMTEMQSFMNGISDKIRILSATDVGVGDIEENGNSFEENSVIKASAVAGANRWAIADDSGLAVDALNGAPGIYSARYSGGNDDDNINKLLSELEGVPEGKRGAKFVCCVTLISPEGEKITVRGECEGVIAKERIGSDGFGYDPVFYIPSLNKTFAQLTAEEKNAISHRGKAMRMAVGILKDRFSGI